MFIFLIYFKLKININLVKKKFFLFTKDKINLLINDLLTFIFIIFIIYYIYYYIYLLYNNI